MSLQEQLTEARSALDASARAIKTHGRQGITWALYKADAERVKELEHQIASGGR